MLTRGDLSQSEYEEIQRELPVFDSTYSTILALSPDVVSMAFPPQSSAAIASVCLRDSIEALTEVKFSLREALAHKIWYEKYDSGENSWMAISFGKYFADNAALRLYSASEHLANGIVNMLEISEADLSGVKKKENRISRQVIVGTYLREKHPGHPITQIAMKLKDAKEWKDALDYRNTWVHDQPPRVKGLGISYARRKRWVITDKYHQLSFGGGDEPKYSIEEILEFIRPAASLFSEALGEVTAYFAKLFEGRNGTTA